MTAEIVILNKTAAALAADSAVTIGRGSASKIYNSVNKIFELHENAPVGVMIYGRLDFMGLPLETLIKQYRSQLHQTFDTIFLYKRNFIEWLSRSVVVRRDDEEHLALLITMDVLDRIASEIEAEILNEVAKRGKYLRSKDNSIAQLKLKRRIDELTQVPRFDYAKRKHISELQIRFSPMIDEAISATFDNRLDLNQKVRALIHKLVIETFARKQLSSYKTGVVIVGFGECEICPSLEHFEMDGILNGTLKYVEGSSIDIGRSGPHADALGFAQNEMIQRFLHGVDPSLYEYMRGMISQSINETAREIVGAFQDIEPDRVELTSPLRDALERLVSGQLTKLKEFRNEEFTKPIFDMIRHMPKQEISNLANALIDLTSLKRKMSREQETVGGDVDVAVVSKSEGFVWVKRKHYFPSDINARFFARHYSNVRHER